MADKINFNLPIVDVNKIRKKFALTEEEESIILSIIYNPLNGVGILRATRPTKSPVSSWVWRSVLMFVSPEEKFHSVTPSLDNYIENSSVDVDVLNSIVDKIVSTIDESSQYGSLNWKNALGVGMNIKN